MNMLMASMCYLFPFILSFFFFCCLRNSTHRSNGGAFLQNGFDSLFFPVPNIHTISKILYQPVTIY